MKNILVVGGAGYVGTVLSPLLLKNEYKVKVLDRFFFGRDTIKENLGHPKFEFVQGDVRHIEKKTFNGIDVVINLAGISNDPACELDPSATKSINYYGAVETAKIAKENGVRRLIFSSSCSVYGHGAGNSLNEESPLNPVSLYATTKMMAEKEILELGSENFTVTILRNATIYGISKRMRFDLVVNLMTLMAYRDNRIYIMGGGLQWRPNVHLHDVAAAFLTVVNASAEKIQKQIFNVGSNEQNYRVIQIAKMVKNILPKTKIENIISDPDQRNYNVNFDKIKSVLSFSVEKDVESGVKEIKEGLEKGLISDDIKTRTLDYYKYLLEANRVIKEVSRRGRIF